MMTRWNYTYDNDYETIVYRQGIVYCAHIIFGNDGLDYTLLVWLVDYRIKISSSDRLMLHTILPGVSQQKAKKLSSKILEEAGFVSEKNKNKLLNMLDNIDWWHLTHD